MKKEYRNVIRTKKMIRNAFIELLEEKIEIGKISVQELIERADLSKSTFYYHYNDIYAVAEEFENELIIKLSEILDRIKIEKAKNFDCYIQNILDFLADNESIYKKVIRASSPKLFIEKLKVLLSKKIFEDADEKYFSADSRIRYVQIRFLTNACVDTIVDYFRDSFDLSLQELGKIIASYLNSYKNF